MMTCSRCKKRPAVVFMTRIEGDNSTNEGLCLVCAKELGLKPVDDLMKRFGINDEELEMISDQMLGGDFGFGQQQEGDAPDFEQGGSPAFPQIFMGNDEETETDESKQKAKSAGARGRRREKPEAPQRKFLDNYCDNLTKKAIEDAVADPKGFSCFKENEPSRKMLSACMRPSGEDDTYFYFEKTV